MAQGTGQPNPAEQPWINTPDDRLAPIVEAEEPPDLASMALVVAFKRKQPQLIDEVEPVQTPGIPELDTLAASGLTIPHPENPETPTMLRTPDSFKPARPNAAPPAGTVNATLDAIRDAVLYGSDMDYDNIDPHFMKRVAGDLAGRPELSDPWVLKRFMDLNQRATGRSVRTLAAAKYYRKPEFDVADEQTVDEVTVSEPRARAALEAEKDPKDHNPEADCRDLKPGTMESRTLDGVRIAKLVCSGCVIRDECLEYALEHGINGGVRGGKTGVERRRILQVRRT